MKGEKQKVHVTWKEKNEKNACHMKLLPTNFLQERTSSVKSQLEVKSNSSWQIEVLTQLKISIWLIKAFIFNASKLFNSKHYPYDNDDMSLDKLLMKIHNFEG
jgi:hypothetical protein